MIGVIGDFNPDNKTHTSTNDALEVLVGDSGFEWMGTDTLRTRWADIESLSGLFIAPASPYRDMEAVLDVVRHARERGVPLVGT